jgi:hypothetical protein
MCSVTGTFTPSIIVLIALSAHGRSSGKPE